MGLLRNKSTGAIIATRVDRAVSFIDRVIGLLTRPNLRPDEGLWIEPCNAIHTIGMRSRIDVIFMDNANRVIATHREVRPFRVALACLKAHSTIELGAGALIDHDLLPGDHLELT